MIESFKCLGYHEKIMEGLTYGYHPQWTTPTSPMEAQSRIPP